MNITIRSKERDDNKITSIFTDNKRKQNPILVGISSKGNMDAIAVQLDTRVAMLYCIILATS